MIKRKLEMFFIGMLILSIIAFMIGQSMINPKNKEHIEQIQSTCAACAIIFYIIWGGLRMFRK